MYLSFVHLVFSDMLSIELKQYFNTMTLLMIQLYTFLDWVTCCITKIATAQIHFKKYKLF